MKILLLSTFDSGGGAGRAAYRLHRALLKNSIESQLWVAHKSIDDLTVVDRKKSLLLKICSVVKIQFSRQLGKLQKSSNSNLHSLALFSSGLVEEINNTDADIVQLNWICNEFISVEDIGKITKPVVWRLSDMWPFCGAEHLSEDRIDARWRIGYFKSNRAKNESGIDFDRFVWERKRRSWDRKMYIVAPSSWMAKCALDSYLMRDWPIRVIPAAINTLQFRPQDRAYSRMMFGLPENKKLILFGAVHGVLDKNKGHDLLKEALMNGLSRGYFLDCECVIFGQTKPLDLPNLGIKTHWVGVVSEEHMLSLLYSSADLVVVPSRIDNLPQVALEAQSCGCPVVGFNATGMPDAVSHGETGYLAKPFDVGDLAFGIDWVISNEERYEVLCKNARRRALDLWSADKVVDQYLDLYNDAILSFKSSA